MPLLALRWQTAVGRLGIASSAVPMAESRGPPPVRPIDSGQQHAIGPLKPPKSVGGEGQWQHSREELGTAGSWMSETRAGDVDGDEVIAGRGLEDDI